MTDDEWRGWTREHRVCYEVRPLVVMQGEQRVQVGFEFELAARLPGATEEGEPQQLAARNILRALGELATRAFPADSEVARFELAPPRGLAQLRRETGFQPEVRRVVKIVHRENALQGVTDGERQRLDPFEHRLKELGVKAGSW